MFSVKFEEIVSLLECRKSFLECLSFCRTLDLDHSDGLMGFVDPVVICMKHLAPCLATEDYFLLFAIVF